MTPTEQRIAIAEACGREAPTDCIKQPPHKWSSPQDGCCYDEVPDYPGDLNAMHEAEKTLDDDQMLDYIRILAEDVCRCYGKYGSRIAICTAPAAQRAEAFLRTIGKWKD